MGGFDLMNSIRNGLLALNVDPGTKLKKVDRTSYLMGAAFATAEKHSGLGSFDAVKLTDPMNIHWWKTTDLQRGGYGSWFAAVPVTTLAGKEKDDGGPPTTGGGDQPEGLPSDVLPMEYEGQLDLDYEPQKAVYGDNYGGEMPAGVGGIASASTGHDKRDLFVTVGGGPIVSQHEGNDPSKYDRYIFEIVGDTLNLEKKGGFSTFTVVKRQVGGCGGGDPEKASVALNFTGDTGPGYGLAAFNTKTVKTVQQVFTGPQGDVSGPPKFVESSKAKSTLAYLSREKKGFAFSGHPTADKHKIGLNADGETLNAGHLHTDSIFSNGSIIFDGPIKFEPTYMPSTGRSLIPTKCFIQWDPSAAYAGPCGQTLYGKWAVWTENPSWIVEPPPRYPRDPEEGPPVDISPVEKAAPSRYGKPRDRGPENGNGGGNGGNGNDNDWEPPRTFGIQQDASSSGLPSEIADLEWQNSLQGAERRLVDLTGMTTKQWYESPHTFHAFATAEIATVPDWTKATPYAYTYNNEVIYVEGENIQSPEQFRPGSANGGECFAPPEVTKSTARYEDKPDTTSQAYFGLWGGTNLEWGYMADDESHSHVRGAAVALGTDNDANPERLIMTFYDDAAAVDTDKALVVRGGVVVEPNILTASPTGGEIRCDSDDSNALKYWDGSAWQELLFAGAAPSAHATTHENAGSDEINVDGLSGLLADFQTPLFHAAAYHENGGADEIDVTGLSGLLADGQTPLAHTHTVSEVIDLTNGVEALTTAEVNQLENIGATIITAADWIAVAALAGVNTGDQTITLTGDVTGSGTGSFAATIADEAVTLAKMAHITTASILGRDTAATGDVEVLSATTVRSILNVADGADVGDVTGPGSSTAGNLPMFSDASGIVLSDSGILSENVAVTNGDNNFSAGQTINGDLYVTGKFTVDGLIDPTGMEFAQVAANPGGVAANTIYIDDGTNYDAGTFVVGTSATPVVMEGAVDIGAPGFEQGAITVQGSVYDALLMVHDIGAAKSATLNLHKHSTTVPPSLVLSRNNTNDNTHAVVADGMELGRLAWMGHDGTDYNRGAEIRVCVDGTPGANDMPSRFEFRVSPDGSNVPAIALQINQDKTSEFKAGVDITGALTLGTALAIAEGGTGATTAAGARANLGAGTGDGDMLSSNNLSDVASAPAAVATLITGLASLGATPAHDDEYMMLDASTSVSKAVTMANLFGEGAHTVIEYTGSGSSGKTVTLTGINRASYFSVTRDDNATVGRTFAHPKGTTSTTRWFNSTNGQVFTNLSLSAPAAGANQVLTINTTFNNLNTSGVTYRIAVWGAPT